MRALRVVGLDSDGAVICECPDQGERFTLPAESLRAAARGELDRLGQTETTQAECQMRPREIQARIRAGASVEQVAEAAGVSAERIDRFAYPVLLERSRTAELAQRAHPVRQDGPDVRTLGEVVANTFSQRGHDHSTATWDSWRGEDGKWVVRLHWTAGRSENRAHWTYHPGAHGGTVTTLDDFALDLIDPDAGIQLRTVPPVTPLTEQPARVEEPARRLDRAERSERAERTERTAERTERERVERAERAEQERAERERAEAAAAAAAAAEPEQLPLDAVTEPEPAAEPTEAVEEVEQQATGTTEPAPVRRGGRRSKPVVPSWEDVLLGVRSNR